MILHGCPKCAEFTACQCPRVTRIAATEAGPSQVLIDAIEDKADNLERIAALEREVSDLRRDVRTLMGRTATMVRYGGPASPPPGFVTDINGKPWAEAIAARIATASVQGVEVPATIREPELSGEHC